MQFNKKNIYLILAFYLFSSCANIKPLEGGKKDTEAPKFVNAFPENKATSVSKSIKEIKIVFDKYITLKNTRDIIISPPPKKPFDFLPRKLASKTLTISPKGELEENTTYVINFGESIADNTEGNKLSFFKYIFSTGPIINSIKINGKIKDAYEQEIPQHVIIALYKVEGEKFEEERLLKEKPYYSAKASKEGTYEFNNLGEGTYQLVAFSDPNSSFIYDSKKEKLGFLSELISLKEKHLKEGKEEENKLSKINKEGISNKKKKLKKKEETQKKDKELKSESKNLEGVEKDKKSKEEEEIFDETFEISLSKEILPFKAFSPKEKGVGVLEFPFEGDDKNLEIKCTQSLERQISLLSPKKDSIEYWYKMPAYKDDKEKKKSFRLEFEVFKEEKLAEKVGINLEDKSASKLDFSLKRKNVSLTPNKAICFYMERPFFEIKKEKIKVENKEGKKLDFEILKDPLNPKNIELNFPKNFEESFKITFEKEALEDILEVKNEQLSFEITIGKESDFGNLSIELLKIPEFPFWLQLLNKKNEIVNEFYSKKKESKYTLKHLDPEEYKLRLIVDENEDKKWNPCNFKERKQAEGVYYSKPFSLKALWEVNESWDYTLPLPEKTPEEEKDPKKEEKQ